MELMVRNHVILKSLIDSVSKARQSIFGSCWSRALERKNYVKHGLIVDILIGM
jgi:hypothetical protein